MNEKPTHPTSLKTQILMFLAYSTKGAWATWGSGFYMPSVQQVFPVGTPEKVQLRFMQTLQRKGLVGGCDCGCRGDYAITELGLKVLADDCEVGQQSAEAYLKNKYQFGY